MTTPESPPSMPPFYFPPELQALYANLVRISHSPAELVLDFARILPGDTAPNVVSRVLMTPLSAKLFLNALNENLARYETSFGEIRLPGDNTLASELFGTVHPPDPPSET
ncbi:MAG TPA: DUF3467 domain-containing protein [Anaerolineaceae bacterium]